MFSVTSFIEPTRIKLVFIVEWVLFILFTAVSGDLESPHQALVSAYPLIFFYLVGCTLAYLSRDVQQIARGWRLLALALGLALIDQGIKAWVSLQIPYQTSVPIVSNWLHLAHEHNPHGSWVVGAFGLGDERLFDWVQWGLALLVLAISVIWHRRYTTHQRRSLWADVALLGIFAGYASWAWDMSVRGYILDYLNLPDVVTADLKDIFIAVGVAAFFAEALDSPELSRRSWR